MTSRACLIGSEGTLGVITAVRLRLLPAPEAAHPAGGVPAHARAGLRGDRDVFAAGLRPSVLDFMDGETLAMLAGAYPGSLPRELPAEAGFALICEVDGSHAEARRAARRAAGADARRARRTRWRWTSRATHARCGAGATAPTRP